MKANTVQVHSSFRRQRGLSIVEFMVGIAIGLFIVGGATKLFVDNLSNNRKLLLETRVNQDLQAAADIVARDLRRARYWSNAAAGVFSTGGTTVTANPHAAVTPASGAASSVTYSYSRSTAGNADDTLDNNENTGFQWASVGGVGVVQIIDGLNNAQSLTDPSTVDITDFSVTGSPLTRNLSSYCSCIKTLTCTLASIAATGNKPTLTINNFVVVLTGRSRTDSSVVRTINETVRARNESLSGTCPP